VTGVSVSGSNVKIKMHEGKHMDNKSRDGTHTTRIWKILGRLHAYLMDDSTGLWLYAALYLVRKQPFTSSALPQLNFSCPPPPEGSSDMIMYHPLTPSSGYLEINLICLKYNVQFLLAVKMFHNPTF